MTDYALKVSDLSIAIGKRVIIEDINFELESASRTAIIGPNGVGKSTLLKTILGLLPVQSGTVTVSGKSVAELHEQERAQLLAYVPQQSHMQFPVPVRDVVAWACYANNQFKKLRKEEFEQVERALAEFGLSKLADRSFDQLSGGEQRRVLLARAAASQANLILCDEPTSHLDMQHILRLGDAYDRLVNQGRSLLLVLHDLRDVDALVDQVILLGHNQYYGPAPLAELVESGVVQDVYGVSIEQRPQYYFH